MSDRASSNSDIAIQVTGLSKTYSSYVKPEGLIESFKGIFNRKYVNRQALKSTDLTVYKGEIVGLVGGNGAGKTTLLKLLSGLIFPTSGTCQVLGFSPWERNHQYLRQMSLLLGQKNQLWWDISPSDSFNLLGKIYDIPTLECKYRVLELAKILDCTHVLDTQLRRLSLGERMKMELIGALLHRPQILFLDEPTIGLDILAQTSIRKFLLEYVEEFQPTVILTSHYMDDIAKLSDRLLLLSQGSLVYNGTVEDFTMQADQKQKITFSLENPLSETLQVGRFQLEAGKQLFELLAEKNEIPQTLARISGLGGIHQIKLEESDFEEVIHAFLKKEL